MKRVPLLVFLLTLTVGVFAERPLYYKYAVFFTQKDTRMVQTASAFFSPKAVNRRLVQGVSWDELDLPVSQALLDTLINAGFSVHSVSRWLNCAIVFSERKHAEQELRHIYGVKAVEFIGVGAKISTSSQRVEGEVELYAKKDKDTQTVYGKSFQQIQQIGVNHLHQKQLLGQGVTVAVIDAGFKNANKIDLLKNAMNQVIGTYDFVEREVNVFDDDEHGTAVWSCMAAHDSFYLVGTAPLASYILLRSEEAEIEFPVEEFYWVMAAEFADSAGVDIISSSLGYANFDQEQFNHTHQEAFKQQAWISKGAKIASQKGMLVVNSSGNEGDNDWRIIAFPADVEEVITVGAVDSEGFVAGFSSVGVKGSKCLKPDVMAPGKGVFVASANGSVYAGNGTSYSCPILAGGLTCLWPFLRLLNQKQLKDLLTLSSNHYYEPNIYNGYGVPDCLLLYHFATCNQADTIFDVRKLNDKNLHIAGYVRHQSQLEVEILSHQNERLWQQTISTNKTGCFRMVLDKTRGLKPGTYQLRYTIQEKKCTFPFQISAHENN